MNPDSVTPTPLTLQTITRAVPLQRATRGWIAQLAWSPDGRLLAAASAGGVAIWRGSLQSTPVFIKQHDGPVKSVAFAPNGTTLATASADTTIKLWDLRAFSPAMQPITTYTDHADSVDRVAIAANGAVVSGSVDGTVRVFQAQRNLTLTAHQGEVNTIALSTDGRLIASGGRDNTIRLWQTATGRSLGVITGHTDWIRVLQFHPSGDMLLSASRDGTARLWDVSDPTAPQQVRAMQHEGDVRAAAFGAAGEIVVTGSTSGALQVWRMVDGERQGVLTEHSKPAVALAFHPRNLFLASGSGDNTILLWAQRHIDADA